MVFRGGEGLRDEIAIIIGQLDPRSRSLCGLHSACLMGDLFRQPAMRLWRHQLRDSVRRMAENGGGVCLLYLDQEGRGTGSPTRSAPDQLQVAGLRHLRGRWRRSASSPTDADSTSAAEDAAATRRAPAFASSPTTLARRRPCGTQGSRSCPRSVSSAADGLKMRAIASKRDRAGHVIDLDLPALLAARD